MLIQRCVNATRPLALVCLLVLSGCVAAAPVQEMSDARQAIQAAVEAGAEDYAVLPLQDARRFLGDAEVNLQRKAYTGARNDAREAKRWAEVAISTALKAAASGNDGQ